MKLKFLLALLLTNFFFAPPFLLSMEEEKHTSLQVGKNQTRLSRTLATPFKAYSLDDARLPSGLWGVLVALKKMARGEPCGQLLTKSLDLPHEKETAFKIWALHEKQKLEDPPGVYLWDFLRHHLGKNTYQNFKASFKILFPEKESMEESSSMPLDSLILGEKSQRDWPGDKQEIPLPSRINKEDQSLINSALQDKIFVEILRSQEKPLEIIINHIDKFSTLGDFPFQLNNPLKSLLKRRNCEIKKVYSRRLWTSLPFILSGGIAGSLGALKVLSLIPLDRYNLSSLTLSSVSSSVNLAGTFIGASLFYKVGTCVVPFVFPINETIIRTHTFSQDEDVTPYLSRRNPKVRT